MNQEITKDGFTFILGDNWTYYDYEQSIFYKNLSNSLRGKDLEGNDIGTKCVDIILKSPNDIIFLIEIKDFRINISGSKTRIKNENLFSHVAIQIRDTIAGLYGAYKDNYSELNHISSSIFKKDILVYAIFIFEESGHLISSNPNKFRENRKNYKRKLAQILKYMNIECNVVCTRDYATFDYGWKVKFEEKL